MHKPDIVGVLFTGTCDSSRPTSMTVGLTVGLIERELKEMLHSILSRLRSSGSRLHET